MRYASLIIVLYTLNLYSAVCQLYLNKTGRNKKVKKSKRKLEVKTKMKCHCSDKDEQSNDTQIWQEWRVNGPL